MERRRLLRLVALSGAGSLAGCERRRQSVRTLTPAPLPTATPTASPTPGISRFATYPCPDLDGPTSCYHERSRSHPLRLAPVREVTTTTATVRFTLHNNADDPATFAPDSWVVWRRDGEVWQSVAAGREVLVDSRDTPATRTLPPGETYNWILVLGDDDPTAVRDSTVASRSLSPGRHAFAVDAGGRTYAALFELVGVRTPGDGSAA